MHSAANSKQSRIAEKIIRSYNRVIAQTDAASYARPQTALEYDKAQIKQAIMVALAALQADERDLRETLTRGFMQLAQFIPEAQAEIVQRGQNAILSGDPNHPDLQYGEQAVQIINRIKAEMEELKIEVDAYIARKAAEQQTP